MKLLLSSDAAPAASMAELTTACRRRSLAGLELRLGAEHRHGVNGTLCPPRERANAPCLPEEHAPVEWLYLPPATSLAMRTIWASGAYRMGAGLILPTPVTDLLPAIRCAFAHGTDPAEAKNAVRWARRYHAKTCWEVALGTHCADTLEAVLDATSDRLAHVRLFGAGPEAQTAEATGANPLWQALALRGYTGTVALAPSPAADLRTWNQWLFESRGWGCNTAANKKDRVSAHQPTAAP